MNDVGSATITGQGFVGDFHYSEASPNKLVIMAVGGSDGGKPDHLATPLFDEGYSVLSLAYFKTEGTPEYLDMIPLEYFDEPIAWLENNEKTRGAGIVIVGESKGAELALLLASTKPQIKGVVVIAPSSVVWQGIPKTFWPPRSSWSLGGRPVPFVPYDFSKGFNPNDCLSMYKQSLAQREAVQKAIIEVEKINGPILLLSGAQDCLWPSSEMGDMICRRLVQKGFPYRYEHMKYADAGHTLDENYMYSQSSENEQYMLGGTYEGNRKARLESAKKTAQFLQAVH